MEKFQRDETIICKAVITDSVTGVATNPATSIKITITDPSGIDVVSAVAMTNDGVGLDHYDYNPAATAKLGVYKVRMIAQDGTRKTIQPEEFELEA